MYNLKKAPLISWIQFIGVESQGGGGMGDGELKAGFRIHLNKKAAIVYSWKHRKQHSVPVRPRRSLEAVLHHV